MSVLHGFLYPKREEKREFYLSGRFQGENGEPLLWEIRPISAEEDLGLRQSVETGSGMDYRRYLLKLAAFSTVTPDLKSEELQDAYSAYGEEELLSRMLPVSYTHLDVYKRQIQDMTTEAANKGFSAAHIYYDEEGKLGYALIPSEQLIPIFDSTDREVLAGMIRYYQKPVVENGQRKMKSMVEYWTEETVTIFTKNEGGREWKTWEKPHWVSVSQQEGKSLAHGWGRPPFLLLKNNADMTGDLTLIKGLIDAYDLISSEGTNDFLDLVGLYWAVCGYSGETAKAIARKLQVNRAVNVSDASGSIEARQVNLPVEGRIEFLRMLRRDIFHFGMGIDVDSELFGTSPSGVSLKFRYAQLDLKANAIAVRLKRLIREMARFFIEDHNRRNGDSWDWKDVEVSLNRTMITNDKETVEMIASSQGLVSRRTLLMKHPFVEDINDEMSRRPMAADGKEQTNGADEGRKQQTDVKG